MTIQFHPYHIVSQSPWPFLRGFSLFFIIIGTAFSIHNNFDYLSLIGLIITLLIIFQWWRDITREATFEGFHTLTVKKGLKLGVILFIVREIFFFIRFFWTYFHIILAPDIEIGISWPPSGITPFNPFQIPLLNTVILLSSGITLTWSHHRILIKKFNQAFISLLVTVLLGFYFTILQVLEYFEASFTISDRVFGSIFFLATGFHGAHVIIGSIFLLVNLFRIRLNHFRVNHHFRFEAAAWYWHFVDVVWLFLYTFMYWWIFYLVSIKSTFNFQLKS